MSLVAIGTPSEWVDGGIIADVGDARRDGARDVGESITEPGVMGVVGVIGGFGVVGVGGLLEELGRVFQAVRLHFVLRFWNQILIWFSCKFKRSAKRCLSVVERYCDELNAFSSSSICTPLNVGRPLLEQDTAPPFSRALSMSMTLGRLLSPSIPGGAWDTPPVFSVGDLAFGSSTGLNCGCPTTPGFWPCCWRAGSNTVGERKEVLIEHLRPWIWRIGQWNSLPKK